MALTDWTKLDRWKVEPGVDYSQITTAEMTAGDLLTITESLGVMDELIRKEAATSKLSTWGTTCVNLGSPDEHITTFNHDGDSFYLVRKAGKPNKIECWKGEYDPEAEGGPTGAVWTADDQT